MNIPDQLVPASPVDIMLADPGFTFAVFSSHNPPSPEGLAKFFVGGKVPQEGDIVDIVCTQSGVNNGIYSVQLNLKVREKTK